mmetsp:Transcript_84259/g.236868  ORF Transcript_84259/g.236868 Transcript_84259/m.236868 type:complete len:379 (+) Transcript_84259:1-1137(+)
MREREIVRLRRCRGDPWPWTDDPALQRARFANVKREHDRTAVIIRRLAELEVAHWDQASASERKRLACCLLLSILLWRRFGTVDFIDRLGVLRDVPESEEEVSRLVEKVVACAVELWREGLHACSDAYLPARNVHNVELESWLEAKGRASETSESHLHKLKEAYRSGLSAREIHRLRCDMVSEAGEKNMRTSYSTFVDSEAQRLRAVCDGCDAVVGRLGWGQPGQTWRRPTEALQALPGHGGGNGVYAAEVLRDLFATPLLNGCTDLDTWTPIDGPTRRCLNRLHGRNDKDEVPQGQLLCELQEVYRRRFELWPSAILGEPSAALQLHDVRQQLSKFESYLRAHAGKSDRTAFSPRSGTAPTGGGAPPGAPKGKRKRP